MPIRRLPRTDEERASALNMAKKRKGEVPVADVPMSTSIVSRLDVAQPEFKLSMQKRGNALSAQADATAATEPDRLKARMYISHFFQVFNLGVARELFPAAHRAFYLLDVTSEAVPPLDSAESIVTWGQRIIEGDAQRVAAGGAGMALPTATEVQTVFDAYVAVSTTQADRKAAYDLAQERVAKLRPDADSLIVRMWNEIEAAYSEDEVSSKRRKSRQWGVVYVSSPGEAASSESQGLVAPGMVKNMFIDLSAEDSITLRNEGMVHLVFYRAITADGLPGAFTRHLMPGEEVTLAFSEFGSTGNFLNVHNPNAMKGAYAARVEGV